MSIKYKVVSKKPGGMAGKSKPKYYPALTERKSIDLRQLCENISDRSTFTTADVYGVVTILTQMIPDLLQEGNNVHLGDLGVFSLSVTAEGQDTPEKVSYRHIKEVKMQFRASPRVKRNLQHTKIRKN